MRDKQIEKMTKDLCDIQCNGMRCNICDTGCEWRMLAIALYNAGYRKSTDVAREIFEEIEKYSEVALMNGHIETPILCIGFGVLAELKKKYESEEK